MSDLEQIFSRGIERFVSDNEDVRKELSRIIAPTAATTKGCVKIEHLRYAAIVRAYRLAAIEKNIDPTVMIQAMGCDCDEDRMKCGVSPKK
jgi:hypothetical protein